MRQDQESKPSRLWWLWWLVIMAICYACYAGVKYGAETVARHMATQHVNHQAAREEEKPKASAPEKEDRAPLETLDSNLDNTQTEFEEWLQLNENLPFGYAQSKLLPDKNFYFRGTKFGMSRAEVKAQEAGRVDTRPSPDPATPENEKYLYYIDGLLGTLQYSFNSAGQLNNIMIVVVGEPLTENEAIAIMKDLVSIFNAAFGTPEKYSDINYGWFTPKMNCLMFTWPSNRSPEAVVAELTVIYTPPASFSSKDVDDIRNALRKSLFNAEKVDMEVLGSESQ